MSEALVPRVERAAVASSEATRLRALIVEAWPPADERFLEFFAAQIANADARGLRPGGRAVPLVVRRARPHAPRARTNSCGGLHPHAPGGGADGETALGGHPGPLRLACGQPGAPDESGGRPCGVQSTSSRKARPPSSRPRRCGRSSTPSTPTRSYDRTADTISLDEIERIVI